MFYEISSKLCFKRNMLIIELTLKTIIQYLMPK